tara:strand:+ start:4907 stop:5098 length:192 start_codon:yes stop_codon:yes gene_type:complete
MKFSKNLVKNAGFDRLLGGKKAGLFTLKNSDGMVAQITNYVGRLKKSTLHFAVINLEPFDKQS